MLRFRVFHLSGAWEMALTFSYNKLFDWIKKYQVGRAAKLSKTIFKTLKKKQTVILFRDEAIGVVKDGCKRWLILYLNEKFPPRRIDCTKPHWQANRTLDSHANLLSILHQNNKTIVTLSSCLIKPPEYPCSFLFKNFPDVIKLFWYINVFPHIVFRECTHIIHRQTYEIKTFTGSKICIM